MGTFTAFAFGFVFSVSYYIFCCREDYVYRQKLIEHFRRWKFQNYKRMHKNQTLEEIRILSLSKEERYKLAKANKEEEEFREQIRQKKQIARENAKPLPPEVVEMVHRNISNPYPTKDEAVMREQFFASIKSMPPPAPPAKDVLTTKAGVLAILLGGLVRYLFYVFG